jgi:PleD family two-component response regulator
MTTPKKDKDKALSLGASNTLSKPIDRSILLSSLKTALMTRKRRENRSLVAKGIALAAGVSSEDTGE